MARTSGEVVVYRWSGAAWSKLPCRLTAEGSLKSAEGEFASDVCTRVDDGVYIVCLDELTMRSEADFHATRRRIALRTLFDNNGDLMMMAQQYAGIACVVIAIILLVTVANMGGTLGHIEGAVNALSKK